MGTKLGRIGSIIASIDDISRHKANFSSRLQDIVSVCFSSGIMHVPKGSIHSDCALRAVTRYANYIKELPMEHDVVGRCDHDVIADLPVDLLYKSELGLTRLDCGI